MCHWRSQVTKIIELSLHSHCIPYCVVNVRMFLVDASAALIKWHCRKDWVGWQTKNGLVSRCLWPSSRAPPASADQRAHEREELAQPGNVTTYYGPSSDLNLQSDPGHLEDSSTGQSSLLLSRQESLGAPATEQVQDRPVPIIPAFVHPLGMTLYMHLPEMVPCLHKTHPILTMC